ncbi:MAG: hypothetical protein K2P81_07540 [Bacteriovoracaceae bacterium]|nr:hypothetical protein [Bacteriovoracaceae bacterium]
MKYFLFLSFMFSFNSFAAKPAKKVVYEYKKYEKFDFEEIGVEGQSGAPGDLSVAPTPKKDYANRLPERKDFLNQMRKAASGIR